MRSHIGKQQEMLRAFAEGREREMLRAVAEGKAQKAVTPGHKEHDPDAVAELERREAARQALSLRLDKAMKEDDRAAALGQAMLVCARIYIWAQNELAWVDGLNEECAALGSDIFSVIARQSFQEFNLQTAADQAQKDLAGFLGVEAERWQRDWEERKQKAMLVSARLGGREITLPPNLAAVTRGAFMPGSPLPMLAVVGTPDAVQAGLDSAVAAHRTQKYSHIFRLTVGKNSQRPDVPCDSRLPESAWRGAADEDARLRKVLEPVIAAGTTMLVVEDVSKLGPDGVEPGAAVLKALLALRKWVRKAWCAVLIGDPSGSGFDYSFMPSARVGLVQAEDGADGQAVGDGEVGGDLRGVGERNLARLATLRLAPEDTGELQEGGHDQGVSGDGLAEAGGEGGDPASDRPADEGGAAG